MQKYWSILTWGILIMLLSVMFPSCDMIDKANMRGPTAPHEAGLYAGFYANRSDVDTFGVYNGNDHVVIQVPAGEYLLIYRATSGGTYSLVFRAEGSALVHIGLPAGTAVAEAILFQGTITETSTGASYGVVTLYSELGASGSSWQDLFRKDPADPGKPLIGGVGIQYIPGEMFELQISKAGQYLLTYLTNVGTTVMDIDAPVNNYTQRIDLQPGEVVQEASIQAR